jgi:hypothetical protein
VFVAAVIEFQTVEYGVWNTTEHFAGMETSRSEGEIWARAQPSWQPLRLMVSSLSLRIKSYMSALPSLAVSIPAATSRYPLLHFLFLMLYFASLFLPSSSENSCSKYV